MTARKKTPDKAGLTESKISIEIAEDNDQSEVKKRPRRGDANTRRIQVEGAVTAKAARIVFFNAR